MIIKKQVSNKLQKKPAFFEKSQLNLYVYLLSHGRGKVLGCKSYRQ